MSASAAAAQPARDKRRREAEPAAAPRRQRTRPAAAAPADDDDDRELEERLARLERAWLVGDGDATRRVSRARRALLSLDPVVIVNGGADGGYGGGDDDAGAEQAALARIDYAGVQQQYFVHLRALTELHMRFRQRGLLTPPRVPSAAADGGGEQRYVVNERRFEQLGGAMWYARHMTVAEVSLRQTTAGVAVSHGAGCPLIMFAPLTQYAELDDYQRLLTYLFTETASCRYRRHTSWVYEERSSPDGHRTHSWQQLMTVDDFVRRACDSATQLDHWRTVVTGGNCARAVDWLTKCVDQRFPTLVKDDHVYAFRNGIYLGATDAFLPYDADAYNVRRSARAVAAQHWYASASTLSSVVVATRYVDGDFDDVAYEAAIDAAEDWYDVPTPSLQGLLDYQHFDEPVCRWMYIMLGRLMYRLGERDGWQVIPFVKGSAGTGKSTLLRMAKQFYEACDVGILANNIEDKFGLANIYTKKIWLSLEVKRDFGLDQADFQSIVSGEDVSVPLKFKDAVQVTWNLPGMMAGNEDPGYTDNSGSISRRIMQWLLNYKVAADAVDGQLDKKLLVELPAIIKKCNIAYLAASAEFGGADIWRHLPVYFRTTQLEMQTATNALSSFLQSKDHIVIEPVPAPGEPDLRHQTALYVPKSAFIDAFRLYCRNVLGQAAPRWTVDLYGAIFQDRHLTVDRRELAHPRVGAAAASARPTTCDYVIGADLVSCCGGSAAPAPRAAAI